MADDNEKKSTEEENKEVADAAPPKEEENLVVEGYEFLSKEDVKKAESDKQKIDILGQKIHSTRIVDLEAVYEKAITNKIFSTPVGWHYLAKLRDKLIAAGVNEEDLIPIPVNTKFTRVDLKDEYHPRQYITPLPQKKKKDVKATFVVLIAMNLILVGLVIAMFVVVWKSDNDNIINYKQNVTNRYAEWEESLKEREKAVRIKERELKIQDDTEYGSEIEE
ncbi:MULTISPECIES: hypothetical protein [unclassified Butyrivibrio]|uniref:hypothetical protein n=1 Tax=unclassified Butyrivibrio TaxID=2639466 RepID=UPI00040C0937|nr:MULTISPECIES: hypothetical protein [unclassified Butyrivibrio]MCR5342772.1 hypothetical protein [Butyrivibrio sp.]